MVVGAQGERAGDNSSQRPGHTNLGGRGVLPRRWPVLKEALWGALASTSLLGGTGNPSQVMDAEGGPAGGSSFYRPGNTSLGGRGVLSGRRLVLKEGRG